MFYYPVTLLVLIITALDSRLEITRQIKDRRMKFLAKIKHVKVNTHIENSSDLKKIINMQ